VRAGTLRVPAFIVIGGGDIGAGYVRQLLRAVAAGRLDTDRIVVVDRDPACAAAMHGDPRVRIEAADWSGWLDARLGEAGPGDHLVPYHWAPHLLLTWLEGQAARAGARTARRTGPLPRGLPYEGTTAAGDRALSYASWVCPPACIEPALCPHTRGAKDWSLAADLEAPRDGDAVDGRIVFRCLHLVYGVGTIPIGDILAARGRLIAGLTRGPRSYLVATSSHCHALATVLEVSPGARVEAGGISTARPGATPPTP
jgi:hypothetical protein